MRWMPADGSSSFEQTNLVIRRGRPHLLIQHITAVFTNTFFWIFRILCGRLVTLIIVSQLDIQKRQLDFTQLFVHFHILPEKDKAAPAALI